VHSFVGPEQVLQHSIDPSKVVATTRMENPVGTVG
jgi:hypothetical protein